MLGNGGTIIGANSLSAFAIGNPECSCDEGSFVIYRKVLLHKETITHYTNTGDLCTITKEYYDVLGRCNICKTIAWWYQETVATHNIAHN